MKVKILENVLAAHDSIAQENRNLLADHGVFAINLMGSPGAGKTAILERTLERLAGELQVAVIEGDIRTSLDAERLSRFGVQIVQINTEPFGGDCHLAAHPIQRALREFDLHALDLLVVENVGNLVCPAEFDVGEDRKAVVLSITEGEDKPLKYPLMFRVSDCVLLNKMDLAEYLGTDLPGLVRNVRAVNPKVDCIQLSARTEHGMDEWISWLRGEMKSEKRTEGTRSRGPSPSHTHPHSR